MQLRAAGKIPRPFAALATAFGLAACTDPASLAIGSASVVTFAGSGKTLTDHAMSLAIDRDCAVRNTLSGKPWCVPNAAAQRAAAASAHEDLHCYRSIAAITCYRHVNPHDTASRRLAAE